MFKNKRWALVFATLLLVVAFAAACQAEPEIVEVTRVITETVEVEGQPMEVTRIVTETEEVVVTVEVPPEEEVVAEPEPEVVDRMGGWLDTIVFLQEPNQDAGVARLVAGDIDVYADDIGGQAAVEALRAAENIETRTQYGLYDEIFFNVGQCAGENQLNPFNNKLIREAMNWAIDRNFVAEELYGGLAVPKFTPISEAGADRARFAPEIRAMEAKYAYDFDKAAEVITQEMEGMGATLEGGVWTYNGEPVNLIFLIRNEDTRLEIGNYVANQLEELGFTVERREGTSGELGPIWAGSDPAECQFNLYTGAWSQTAVARDDFDNFDFFYTPRGYPVPSWAVMTPSPELDEVALRLINNDYADLEERAELFRTAIPLALEDSARVWVTSRTTLVPFNENVAATADLAAGLSGAALWSHTIRFVDEVGGSMTIALPSVFTEPWNPIGGSNWVFDGMVQNGVSDQAFYTDPSTGIQIPGRAERAEVVVQEGFPMGTSQDWVTLTTEPEIVVPDDAWVDWDAENQVFLTAADVYTETQTAVFKSTVYYPEDMFDTVTWHDGSPISLADFIIGMIVNFDLAKEASPYYDETLVPDFEQFMSGFRGTRIASTDPLVIEYWGNNAGLDAENTVVSWWPGDPGAYDYGDAAWHNMALLLRGEGNGEFALSDGKAEANELEKASMIAGPSLEIMASALVSATEEAWLPYAPTLGEYVTADEATTRYNNLAEFVRRYGHYYIGTGPYFLSGVFPVEGQAVLTHNPNHADPANRYEGFAAPALPVVEIDGPARVTIGEEAAFEVFVDVFDGPYPTDDLSSVSYLLFDATGAQVGSGEATAVEDGVWEVVLSGDTTGALAEGSNRLDVVVVSNLVALPSIASYEFVTAP